MVFRLLKVTPSFARAMSTNATTVGFIGLGQMGNRMATNLMNKVKTKLNHVDDKTYVVLARDVPTFSQSLCHNN
jgi:predicted homoserine dehydrogenase-like protein